MSCRTFHGSVLVALLLVVSDAAASAAVEAAAAQRPSISLALKARAAYAYRHEYTIVVRVRVAASGRPLSSLGVVASGSMDEPGHAMTARPARLRSMGNGTYRGAVAFYMSGEWRIRSP